MFESEEYQLLDFGAGRKLERFGVEILDRPSPAAEGNAIAEPELWAQATARFEDGMSGTWHRLDDSSNAGDARWSITHPRNRLILQLGPSGNVGVFPEHADNWDWIATEIERGRSAHPARPFKVLNLFGYTGGATLAAAAAGAEVTHVDSSGPTVAWAKRNAAESGLSEQPIRWLVEDAMKFVARELRRGNGYDGVIADPPSYGHGPKGRPFKFHQHATELIESCAALLDGANPGRRFFVFSCHTPGFGSDDAESALRSVLPAGTGHEIMSEQLGLVTGHGRSLPAGVCARWRSA